MHEITCLRSQRNKAGLDSSPSACNHHVHQQMTHHSASSSQWPTPLLTPSGLVLLSLSFITLQPPYSPFVF